MVDNNHYTMISKNLKNVLEELISSAQATGRDPSKIVLVAVSKTHSSEVIRWALEAGHRIFGENKVQESRKKWLSLKADYPDARLHLIGPLQSNKVSIALSIFDVIETLDRPKLARVLARQIDKTGQRPDCFIQINTGEEDQKSGVLPLQADNFISFCRDELDLPIRGLMCIPPINEEASLHFALLSKIAKRNGLRELSMGMSSDYSLAVRFGATHVRVGTAIFGKRNDTKM